MKIISDNVKRNFKNSFLFFLPSIVAMCIQLISTPIFSKNMSSYDYSVMGYFNAFQQLFMPIMNMSLFPYYMSGYHKRTEAENNTVLINIIVFLAVTNLVTILLGIVGLYAYFKIANVSFPLFPYVIFSLFTPYFSIFVAALTMNYKMHKKAKSYAIVQSMYPIISIGVGLLFVVIFHWGAKGRMGAILFGQLTLGVYAFSSLYKSDFKFDFDIIKKALKLGYPLIIITLLQFPVQNIDKLFLERLDNIDSFALYNIGLKFSGIIMMVGSSLFQAFEPDFYKYIGKKEWKKLLITASMVFGSLIFINIIFNLVSKPVIALLTSYRYTEAYAYSDIAIWANLMLFFTYLLSIFFVVYERTKSLLLLRIILAGLSMVIWALFINRWEFMGAVWARVAINSVNVILMIIFLLFMAHKKGKAKISTNRIINGLRFIKGN